MTTVTKHNVKKNKPQQYNPGEKTRDERNKWNDERKNGKHIKEKITDRIRAKKKEEKYTRSRGDERHIHRVVNNNQNRCLSSFSTGFLF